MGRKQCRHAKYVCLRDHPSKKNKNKNANYCLIQIPILLLLLLMFSGSDEQKLLEASMAYASGNPIMSDAEFDELKLRLKVGPCFHAILISE